MFLTPLPGEQHCPEDLQVGPRWAASRKCGGKQGPRLRCTQQAPGLYCRGLSKELTVQADLAQPLRSGDPWRKRKPGNAVSALASLMPGGPPGLPPFLTTQQNNGISMPSMACVWAPPPPNGPIQSPTKSEAPRLTACVRRALNTKGGVSRFSAHFTIVHQRRNKSKPSPSAICLRQCRGWALPRSPKCNLSWLG